MTYQTEHFFTLPNCYIHAIICADELDSNNNILDPRHLSAIYQNIQEYYQQTKDAQDRAYALSTLFNVDRTVDEIQRRARCSYVSIAYDTNGIKWEEASNAN